jgi:hypothetical protein
MTSAVLDARYLNRCSRELAGSWSVEPVPFFCECADLECRTTVWLTVADYDSLLAGGATIVAAGHELPELEPALLARVHGVGATTPAG